MSVEKKVGEVLPLVIAAGASPTTSRVTFRDVASVTLEVTGEPLGSTELRCFVRVDEEGADPIKYIGDGTILVSVNNNKEDPMESPGNPDPPAEPEAPAEGGDQVGGDKVEGDKVEPSDDGQADPSGGDN